MLFQNTSHTLKRRRAGSFISLALTSPIMAFLPYNESEVDISKPRRKHLSVPMDNDTFVKPIKQSFVKNPRLMPMTRLMLTLIAGWAGQGGSIETTTGILAKHLSRSTRQVFRYLKDAVEEGYLTYSKTKGRLGLYTGIKIWLNFAAIRFTRFQKKGKKVSQTSVNSDMTLESDTNTKYLLSNDFCAKGGGEAIRQDDEIFERLLSFGETLGYFEKKDSKMEHLTCEKTMGM